MQKLLELGCLGHKVRIVVGYFRRSTGRRLVFRWYRDIRTQCNCWKWNFSSNNNLRSLDRKHFHQGTLVGSLHIQGQRLMQAIHKKRKKCSHSSQESSQSLCTDKLKVGHLSRGTLLKLKHCNCHLPSWRRSFFRFLYTGQFLQFVFRNKAGKIYSIFL